MSEMQEFIPKQFLFKIEKIPKNKCKKNSESKYVCDFFNCNKIFNNNYRLNVHIRTHVIIF